MKELVLEPCHMVGELQELPGSERLVNIMVYFPFPLLA